MKVSQSIRSLLAPALGGGLMFTVGLVSALGGPGRGADADRFPNLRLRGPVAGAAAVTQLGQNLPGVAAAYGIDAASLRLLFLRDGDLAADAAGRLHYLDSTVAPGPVGGSTAAPGVSAIDPASALALHSRPGASRTIYLDFDGHTMSGNGWTANYNGGANIVAPAFDTDGNPASFSTAERNVIIETWQRVAEDFAPFDVDVTTELASESLLTRSGSTDNVYGTRVLISPISQYWGAYGGIAYVGVFDAIGDYYKPALVFPENLGWSAKNIAEAASHEAGHNLGLNHDGTASVGYYSGHGSGETGWAPIMGVGYYQNLSQWSRGEYLGANNTENDLAIISTYGLPGRADDHGDAQATASPLAGGSSLTGSGVIGTAADVDVHWFSVGATSAITLNVAAANPGPNLDIIAELRDASGTLLGSANAAGSVNAAFTGTLNAGTYYLTVGGAGLGDPLGTGYSDYGSLGQYSITGTVTVPNAAPTAVIAATPVSGTAPLVVSFNGSGSTDSDGSIVSYSWNFGDGTTAAGVAVNKTYSAAGNYNATLTVTDDRGATASAAQTIVVSAPPQTVLVKSIALTKKLSKGKYTASAVVTVVDQTGKSIGGVTVNGVFSGAVSGTRSGTTATSGKSLGKVTLTSPTFTANSSVTFTITGLSRSGYTYSAANNVVTSVTIP